MRAFLLAKATTAFCQPDRSLSASTQREIGSLRVWAVLTTDLAPWISRVSHQAHWHYFEMCAQANAEDLRRKAIISEQAFQTLRAVQDDSLSWLARIPVDTLAELISNNEHRWLREELNKYTAQLTGGATVNPNDMVREVNFGLASLVQRQQKAMADIERKYAPKKSLRNRRSL